MTSSLWRAPVRHRVPTTAARTGPHPGTGEPAPGPARRPGRRASSVGLALRIVTAVALAVSAYIHLRLADGYGLVGQQVTEGDLFLAQASAAAVAALALLVRPARLTWALAAVVGFGSLAAVVLTVYVAVPAIGPFPRVYEPIWFPEKVTAAVAAALAAAAATAGLLRHRRATARAAGRSKPTPGEPADRRRPPSLDPETYRAGPASAVPRDTHDQEKSSMTALTALTATRLHLLHDEQGQSPWLDDLTRGYLTGGELSRRLPASAG